MLVSLTFCNVFKNWHILGSNKIKTLDAETFHGFNHLKKLYLDNNQIEIVEKDLFQNTKLIEEISLCKYI